jgi:hypothetical protein
MEHLYKIVKEEVWDSYNLRYTFYYIMERKNDPVLKEKWTYVRSRSRNKINLFCNLKFKRYLEASLYIKEKLKGSLVE